MIVLINGSFGVGKTTVARLLVSNTPSSTLLDPELIGLALQLPLRALRRNSPAANDFQNIALWRQLTIFAAKSLQRLYDVVYVPMAFSNLDYLSEVRGGLESGGGVVHHFCLVAPVETIVQRLNARGVRRGTRNGDWVFPRVLECAEVHRDAAFTIHISAEGSACEISADILSRLH